MLLMGFEEVPGKIEQYREQLAAAATGGVVIVVIPYDRQGSVCFGNLEDGLAFQQFMQACHERGGITHVMNDGVFEQLI